MTYSVRLARESDINWICNEAGFRMLTEEVGRPELVNPEQMLLLAEKGIREGTLIVGLSNDEPVGVIGGVLVNNLFNPAIKTLAELFWYVVPEYRKTKIGLLLLKAFEKVGKDLANEITFSILLSNNDIKIETMEKLGYSLQEFGFQKEL